MKIVIKILVFLFSLQIGYSQTENLIPNFDFEDNSQIVNEEFITTSNNQFNNLIAEWNSPTTTTPDIIKGKTNNTKIGIMVYGIGNCKSEWREYIQVKLKRKLLKGKDYKLEFKIQLKENTSPSNNLGFLFRNSMIKQKSCDRIKETPQIKIKEVINTQKNEWINWEAEFRADDNYEYLIIGNFNNDRETKIGKGKYVSTPGSILLDELLNNVSHYYLDEIILIEK